MDNEIEVQDRVSEYYENIRYRNRHSFFYHKYWIRRMLACVNTQGLLLDNGCGIGILSELQHAHRVVGIDISSNMVAVAKTRNSLVVQGNSEKLPFESDSFNIVFCKGLLHHLENPALAITEMHRVLRNKGEVVLVDTNWSIINSLPRLLAKRSDSFSTNHKNFRAVEYIRALQRKFDVETVQFFGYFAYPLLGFPDLFDFSRWLPCGYALTKSLVKFDRILERIPFLRKQGWAILVKARKIV